MSAKEEYGAEEVERAYPGANLEGGYQKDEKQMTLDGTINLIDEDGNIRRVPTASADPNDPLRLPHWRKVLVLIILCLFTGGGMTAANSISGIIPQLTMYYDAVPGPKPSSQIINAMGSFPSLFIGIGAILSVIAAQAVGTRPVMIFDSALAAMCMIWAARSTGHDRGLQSHLAARCIMSLGVGAAESLVPLIMSELNYLHTRNTWLAIVWAAGGMASSGIGSASSFIVNALGWRTYYWILFAISSTAFVLIVLVVPETNWPRTSEDLAGTAAVGPDGFSRPVRPSRREISYMYSLRWTENGSSMKRALQCIKDMLRCSLFPNMIWIIVLNACLIGTTVSSSLEFGSLLVFGYHWSAQNAGLLQVPLAIASVLSVPVVGPGADWLLRYMARRNNGIHEPEHQLVNLILPVICGFLGTLLFGVFADPEQYHWIAPMLMTGLQFWALVSSNVITMTYAIECFPDLAEPMVIVVGAYRNIIGFALSYSVTSFVESAGFRGCFGAYAGILGFLGLLGIPLYFKGKTLRHIQNTWSIRHSRSAHLE